ncbi:hypothetical protein DVH05_003924 [Phytophthora capsici]|nr:hypothetical protein DVH05_003924 [Phytophthora capsici]
MDTEFRCRRPKAGGTGHQFRDRVMYDIFIAWAASVWITSVLQILSRMGLQPVNVGFSCILYIVPTTRVSVGNVLRPLVIPIGPNLSVLVSMVPPWAITIPDAMGATVTIETIQIPVWAPGMTW